MPILVPYPIDGMEGLAMLEALWTINFITAYGTQGGGVIVFESGRLFGGDASYYYIGDYTTGNGKIEANVKVVRHNAYQQSVFGDLDEFDLVIEGDLAEPDMKVLGRRPEVDDVEIGIALRKQTPLP